MRDIMVLIPLSAKFYAVFYDGHVPTYISSNKVNNLQPEEVEEINEAIINNSYIKCIGSNKQALEKVKDKFDYNSPVVTYAGGNGAHFGATIKKEVFFYQNDRDAWELFNSFDWLKYRGIGRNDPCACGSGKKYKNCCMRIAEICIRMYSDIELNVNNYKVHDDAIGDKSIDEFYTKGN